MRCPEHTAYFIAFWYDKYVERVRRLAELEYLKANGGKISDAGRVFGINRTVVYDILKKEAEGNPRRWTESEGSETAY